MKEKQEQTISVIFAIVGVVAIFTNLFIKGFSTENLLDAVKEFAGLFLTIIIFLVAFRISSRTTSFLETGKRALVKLYLNHISELDGIKANSEKAENDEENDKRNKYLFINRKNKNLRTKITFIPVNDLEDGVLDIRVSKATLVNKGLAGTPEEISQLKDDVASGVKDLLAKKGFNQPDDFEFLEHPKSSNSAIVVDFEEHKLKHRKFGKIVYACAEKALAIIQDFRK